LIITHDKDSAAMYADRTIQLVKGTIESDSINNIDIDLSSVQDVDSATSDTSKLVDNSSMLSKTKSLPAKYSIGFGVQIATKNKFRLVYLVIFPAIVLVVFGLALSTIMFDIHKARIKDWMNKGAEWITISSAYTWQWLSEDDFVYGRPVNPINVNEIRKQTPAYGTVYSRANLHIRYDSSNSLVQGLMADLFGQISRPGIVVNESNHQGLDLVYGEFPKNANEIVITDAVFEAYRRFGYDDSSTQNPDSTLDIQNYEDVIGLPVRIESVQGNIYSVVGDVNIVGILHTGIDIYDFYN